MWDYRQFVADRALGIDASGIRKVFDLAASLDKPINLSIGQPDFDVPDAIKEAAVASIRAGRNRYTQTQGIAPLHARIEQQLACELPHWQKASRQDEAGYQTLITSGVSGGLVLAMLTCVQPGDEVLVPDPYFVMYKHLVTLAGGKAVYVDTYPDFRMTAERVEPLLTERTKLVLFNSPSNPTGVVSTTEECKALAELCEQRGVLLLTDEIYDEFCYEKEPRAAAKDDLPRCPSPASFGQNMLLLRGFSKTYGMTGWRLGYVAGPAAIINQMTKLQQYTFVCAPSMVQDAGVVALDMDMSQYVQDYARKRDIVVEMLSKHYELAVPAGAFYAFPKVPEHLNLTATQFVEKMIKEHQLLIIPGSVFSERDTHFRLSYACDEDTLQQGLEILVKAAR